MQTKRWSLIETLVNAVTSYGVAVMLNWWLIPIFYPGVQSNARGSIGLTLAFTAVSVVRTYLFRRIFVRLGRG